MGTAGECDPTTGEPRPAAAESWEWSPDRKVLTLKLRPDARWSNGDRVTAHDFVRGWGRVLRQNMAWAQTLFPLRNAEAYHRGQSNDLQAVGMHTPDDFTLRLELDQVRSTLVAELADPLLSPLHASSERMLADNSYFSGPEKLVTNGPFQLQSANYSGYRLRVCPYYYGRKEVRLAGVQFLRAGSPATATLFPLGLIPRSLLRGSLPRPSGGSLRAAAFLRACAKRFNGICWRRVTEALPARRAWLA